jgi:DNA mismatch repair protein MutS2
MYPKDLESKIGFDTIRHLISEHCLSVMGQKMVNSMSFSSQTKSISLWLCQTDEFKRILEEEEAFPSENYFDISVIIKQT